MGAEVNLGGEPRVIRSVNMEDAVYVVGDLKSHYGLLKDYPFEELEALARLTDLAVTAHLGEL